MSATANHHPATHGDAAPNSRRKLYVKISIYVVLLVTVVGLRGVALAWVVEGYYPWWAWLSDVAGLGLIILILHAIQFAVRWVLQRVIGQGTRVQRAGVSVLHICLVACIAFPLLLALLHLHPQRAANRVTPAELELAYKDVKLTTSDGIGIAAWDVPAPQLGAYTAKTPVFVVVHGVAANRQNMLGIVAQLNQFGMPCVVIDLRGHGDSGGRTCTFGVREAADVMAAADYARQAYPGRKVAGLGISMGGAAVLNAAAQGAAFDYIIVTSTFADFEQVALNSVLRPFGELAWPLWQGARFWGWVLSGVDLARHRPVEYVAAVAERPLLIAHGDADQLISIDNAKQLYDAAGGNAKLFTFEGADHNDVTDAPGYWRQVRQLVEPATYLHPATH